MSQPGNPQPWLKNRFWAAREIRKNRRLSPSFLVLLYVVVGAFAIVPLMRMSDPPHTLDKLAGGLLLLCMLVVAAAGLTYLWFRYRRSADSVCRLITLPGVIGGWFKADVECMLPTDPTEPVIVRLRNLVNRKPSPFDRSDVVELWRMEEKLAVPVAEGARSVVRVRLRVPRDPAQRPIPPDTSFREPVALEDEGNWWWTIIWYLEIEKKTRGIDFFVRFDVPIYDTANAPASEQQPD